MTWIYLQEEEEQQTIENNIGKILDNLTSSKQLKILKIYSLEYEN